jgi:hypothetical protein
MNWLQKAASGLVHYIHDLFTSPEARQRAEAAFEQAGTIAAKIYPIVKEIAALTPNRTDDEIIACIEQFGLTGLIDQTKPDKGDVLHDIASAVATKEFGASGSLASFAIETAYQALRANAEPKAA